MTYKKAEDKGKAEEENPALKDVEPSSDADEKPVAAPGHTPPSPNPKTK